MTHYQDNYITAAIEGAAVAVLWQASDASENGGDGFPISDDDDGSLRGETQFVDRVIEEVPYLTAAVTAFVTDNWALLLRGRVTAPQAGHDIVLTANHCGVGFWDRGLTMPATDDEALAAWRALSRADYAAWLAAHRPDPAQRPQSVGDALTAATGKYSFDAEFQLDDDGDVTWLMVGNVVLVDELGLASDPGADPS
jgi:hypothetical protein